MRTPGGGGEGVDGQQSQRGGEVDEDVIEVGGHLVQMLLQVQVVLIDRDRFQFEAGQLPGRGDDLQVLQAGGGHRLAQGDPPQQHLVGVGALVALLEAQAGGGIGLGIQVDQQHPLFGDGQCGGQVDGGGGLAHPPFLIGDGYDFTHDAPDVSRETVRFSTRQSVGVPGYYKRKG